MKKIALIAAATFSATASFAGSVTYIAPEVVAIEEPSRMGGSGAWIIPLIIAAVILLAVTQNNEPTPVVAR